MGCGQLKQDSKQLEDKNFKSNVPISTQVSMGMTVIQKTEAIDTDYILHKLDPLATLRSYIRKGISKTQSQARIIRTYNCSNASVERKQQLQETINLLLSLKHLNIQSTSAYYYCDCRLSLIGEFIDGGNLLTQLDKFSQLQQYQQIEIFCQIMAGVQYLHDNGVMHGDIRLEHILFTNRNLEKIKLIDFGIPNSIKSEFSSWKPKNTMQELSFKSPDTIKGQSTFKSDIYSCGCLLYFIITSHMPFQANNYQSLKSCILRGVPNFDSTECTNMNPQMKQLLSKMLDANPQRRPSAQEVLNHPVLNNRNRIMYKPNKQLYKHMKEFKISSQIQAAMLMYIAENMMSEQDKKRLMDEFQKYDLNKDGQLTKDELLKVYSETLPPERALKEVNTIFKRIDVNGSGKIDYQEFIIATIDQKKYFNREKLLLLFTQIDRDHSGELSRQEIKKLLRDMQIPNNKYEQLVKQLDQDGDGAITQDEFLKMMLQI
ncbi:unnamed protein product (macronuclear) [Paramecium tetraurelia]|uniref:Protein kinase domain containing protein n=1 Tax=Paramecium tetraurelia TaxID=5888 RepID=A0DDA5_PARTE|nr:uncharacterized protein GSPATT00015881001 [Paramecium tetraurelia]CAK81022.1 unnamed protein product [Paramecium tetraurelia]|eukprot:XP_001448419.1 hypothetical protein (macronuclear) [Paramecium tetraurelia strain d4-2]